MGAWPSWTHAPAVVPLEAIAGSEIKLNLNLKGLGSFKIVKLTEAGWEVKRNCTVARAQG